MSETYENVRKWWHGWDSDREDTGIEIVWEYDEGGYDWECLALVRRAHGDTYQYAVFSDAGCSCRGPYEDHPDTYDLQWSFDKKAVVTALIKAVRDSYYMSDGDKASAKAELAAL